MSIHQVDGTIASSGQAARGLRRLSGGILEVMVSSQLISKLGFVRGHMLFTRYEDHRNIHYPGDVDVNAVIFCWGHLQASKGALTLLVC